MTSNGVSLFEAVEKKAEIILATHTVSLLKDIDNGFWHQMISACQASILSTTETTECKAFILSESSLFIWNSRLLILTCGTAPLIKAIEFFIRSFLKVPLQIIYQRQQERSTAKQLTTFNQDVIQLNQYFSGQRSTLHTENMANQHIYVGWSKQISAHHENIALKPKAKYEWCGYELSTHVCKQLIKPDTTSAAIRNFLKLSDWFKKQKVAWTIDDYCFSPYGYSLNAVSDQQFVTLHLTPQSPVSYISVSSDGDISSLITLLIGIFQPQIYRCVLLNNFFDAPNLSVLVDNKVVPAKSAHISDQIIAHYWLINHKDCYSSSCKSVQFLGQKTWM